MHPQTSDGSFDFCLSRPCGLYEKSPPGSLLVASFTLSIFFVWLLHMLNFSSGYLLVASTIVPFAVLCQPRKDTQPPPKRCWIESESGITQWEQKTSGRKKPQKHRRRSEEKSWWRQNKRTEQKFFKMGGETNLAWVYCIYPHHKKIIWCKCIKLFSFLQI